MNLSPLTGQTLFRTLKFTTDEQTDNYTNWKRENRADRPQIIFPWPFDPAHKNGQYIPKHLYLINILILQNIVKMITYSNICYIVSGFLEKKVPIEIKVLGYNAMRSFYYSLVKEHYVNNLIRCMFVGHWGVGKTTLVKGLLEESQRGIISTDGIEVHVRRCYYDKENRRWHIQGMAGISSGYYYVDLRR